MGPIQVVVQDGNNLVLEVTPTPNTTVILDRGIAGPTGPAGPGDVNGPASATDNALARFDGTTGKLIQNSVGTLSDTGALVGLTDVDTTNLEVANVKAQDGTAAFSIANTTGVVSIDDTKFTLQDNTDTTKKAQFELSGNTTATTRIYTLPNLTGSLATIGTLTQTFSGTTTFSGATVTVGSSTATSTYGLGSGASIATATKTINIGTAGVSGSITNINYGSVVAGSLGTHIWGIGGEQMRLTTTGLGIGTSSPGYKLDILGGAIRNTLAGGGVQLILGNSLNAVSLGAVQASGDASLAFYTNTSIERLRLDAPGNLGLGVTPSAWAIGWTALQFGARSSVVTQGTISDFSYNVFRNASNADVYIGTDFATRYRQQTGQHQWFTAPSGVANSTSITTGVVYVVAGLGSSTLAQWQAFFSALTVLPTVGQSITATATGTLLGGGTVTQTITFTQGMILDASNNLTVVGSVTASSFVGNATNVTGTVAIANGGTGATTAPAGMANLTRLTATATAAGTTTLTNASTYFQLFTGTNTQTVVLPVTSTLQTGWTFHIINNSTGVVTVNSSGGNLVISVPVGVTAMCTCIGTALTTAADWEAGLTDFSTATGTGSVVLSASPTFTGTPASTTAAEKVSTTQVATTAFVDRLRSLTTPTTAATGGTAVVGDRGALLAQTSGSVTIPASIFAARDVLTIYNNSAVSQTITQGAGLTLYLVGTPTTGNRTLAQRGLATVVFISATEAVISGGGLT